MSRASNRMAGQINDFLLQKGLADTSVESYRWFLLQLSAWLQNRGGTFEDLTGPLFMKWLNGHRTWGGAMRRLATGAMRSFVRWHYGDENLCLKVRIKPDAPAPQRTLSQDEAATLVGSLEADDPCARANWTRTRDLAIVSLMLDVGLRASEVVRLETANIDMKRRSLMALCKGGRWRSAYFSVRTRIRLAYWLAIRPKVAKPGVVTVFVGIVGKTPGRPMTTGGLRAVFRILGNRAGIEPASPHSLRRSMAVLSTLSGAPSRLVMLQGGWSSLKLVERYTQSLSPEAFAPYSPVEAIARAGEQGV